jgi:hypothetical protein
MWVLPIKAFSASFTKIDAKMVLGTDGKMFQVLSMNMS